MASHMLVVLSNAVEGQDDTFNDWYTNRHLGDVLKVPGFSAAQRFALSGSQLGDGSAIPYKYLAIYEVDAEDAADAAKALQANVGGDSMYIDPSIDMTRTVAWFYTPITERVTE